MRTPPPVLTAVQLANAGFYSMVLSWIGPPERRITVRLRAPATNLREAQAEAADQLLSFEPATLAWLYEHAQPTVAHMPDQPVAANQPVEREEPIPSPRLPLEADLTPARRPAARSFSSTRAAERRTPRRAEGGEARST